MNDNYPYIRKGKFIGSFEVVCFSGEVIPCYNISTARAIKQSLREAKNDICDSHHSTSK